MAKTKREIKEKFQFMPYVSVIYISAKTGRNCDKIFPEINKVYLSYINRVSTRRLNLFLKDIMMRTPPPNIKGKQLKIYYMTQTGISPPTFVFFVNKSKLFHFSYQRHIENKLREEFEFCGSPIRFVIRQKGDTDEYDDEF